jgi:hypothetical protein
MIELKVWMEDIGGEGEGGGIKKGVHSFYP